MAEPTAPTPPARPARDREDGHVKAAVLYERKTPLRVEDVEAEAARHIVR